MPIPSREQLTYKLSLAVEDHACPYAERVLETSRMRNMGLTAQLLTRLMDDVERIHKDGICPPTHVGTSPTTEWSDLVHETRY